VNRAGNLLVDVLFTGPGILQRHSSIVIGLDPAL
jgi:hypothetical protein